MRPRKRGGLSRRAFIQSVLTAGAGLVASCVPAPPTIIATGSGPATAGLPPTATQGSTPSAPAPSPLAPATGTTPAAASSAAVGTTATASNSVTPSSSSTAAASPTAEATATADSGAAVSDTPGATQTATAADTATDTATAPTTATATAAPTSTNTVTPAPSATPSPAGRVKTVIFFIQENHTFDSLFAGFPGADSLNAGKPCADRLPADPPHQHADSFRPGAYTSSAADCSYTEQSAATYWQLARQFALCDRFFSDVRGPSHPNYFMMTSAQTPIVNTPYPTDECPDFCYDIPTLANRLDDAHLAWRDYGGIMTDIKSLVGRPEVMDRQDAQYFADAAAGTLPSVGWLNSDFLNNGDELSGHPVGSLCNAQQYAVKVINAALASPQWESMVMFLVWDDWGGFYDHVVPPVVERWTDGTPLRYGFRVPCIVISPFTRSGYVSHELHSFVSMLHFAEITYGLPPLNQRDAAASALLDCFDFGQKPLRPSLLAMPDCS
jgi:phospholipase C